ncbi:M14 family metallopeptidase [Candidatus Uabimicrobium amorphum]|uniref:Peptidase M14 n=1 Tax=Uabimicrobium amorphum TaxID=2596890 RepID=A0A5S9IMX5_UABAM|nr:M14 family metallopeptidase [Candidatus Uabimicrobium amorphum]BBM84858.1 peptidase M14 [Candidatus Uabimicrobium amorphum]
MKFLYCWWCMIVFTVAQMDSLPLPPQLPWQGRSEELIVPADHREITPVEKAKFMSTPRYKETILWMKNLVDRVPEFSMQSIGQSDEGRDIWMVIASKERAFSPEDMAKSKKGILLVQAGIHSGEIDGKDAGMMLLRDMAFRGKMDLLKNCHLLFVPILSVDGHERFSLFNRSNQRGPHKCGWRTNAKNLNLNRDYAKLDTPELQALIQVVNKWKPDLYFDIHVTNGADYQYDITFGFNGGGFISTPCYAVNIGKWLNDVFRPHVSADLSSWGHIPGPLVFAMNGSNMYAGVQDWTALPRFSNGYGDLRNLATILVENHSLKPYKQRVLGTYVLIESAMQLLGKETKSLRAATAEDRKTRAENVVLSWLPDKKIGNTDFRGVSFTHKQSTITGSKVVVWTGKAEKMNIPVYSSPGKKDSVNRPKAYWIPAVWKEIIERLQVHGIEMQILSEPQKVKVKMYRVTDYAVGTPYEGHIQVKNAQLQCETVERVFPKGSVRVSTNQDLGNLAIVLLEPKSPDSFFQWGFFWEVFQRTEYVEAYVMEPLAQQMLEKDPQLAKKFKKYCAENPKASAREKLYWFYQQTSFFDSEWKLYPIGVEE